MKTPKTDKIRTPSGTIITQCARDIRVFFENEELQKLVNFKDLSQSACGSVCSLSSQEIASTLTGAASPNLKEKQAYCVASDLIASKTVPLKHVKSVNKLPITSRKSAIHGNFSIRRRSKRLKSQVSQQEENYFTPPSTPKRGVMDTEAHKSPRMIENENTSQKQTGRPIQAQSIQQELKQMIQQVSMESDNKATDVISVKAVMSMFKRMEEKMDELIKMPSEKSPDNSEATEKINRKIKMIETKAATATEVSSLRKELVHQKFLNRMQGGSIQRLTDIVQELANRIDNIELNNSKRSVTLTNLDEDRDTAISQIGDFFENAFGFRPEIEDFYSIGSAMPRTVVITFQNLNDKKYIMQNKTDLKGYATAGKSHFINDFLPAAINEKRRRDREISGMFPENEISFNCGKIQIQGAYYKPKVTPPAHDEMIKLSLEELDFVLAKVVTNGDMFVKDGNEFTGYTIPVNNIKQIKEATYSPPPC